MQSRAPSLVRPRTRPRKPYRKGKGGGCAADDLIDGGKILLRERGAGCDHRVGRKPADPTPVGMDGSTVHVSIIGGKIIPYDFRLLTSTVGWTGNLFTPQVMLFDYKPVPHRLEYRFSLQEAAIDTQKPPCYFATDTLAGL